MRAWRASLILGPSNGAGLWPRRSCCQLVYWKSKKALSSDQWRIRQTALCLADAIIYSHLYPIHKPFTQPIARWRPSPSSNAWEASRTLDGALKWLTDIIARRIREARLFVAAARVQENGGWESEDARWERANPLVLLLNVKPWKKAVALNEWVCVEMCECYDDDLVRVIVRATAFRGASPIVARTLTKGWGVQQSSHKVADRPDPCLLRPKWHT